MRLSDLRVGVRLGVGLGLLLALLAGCAAVGLSGLSTLRSAADDLASAQQLTRRVMQVKFRSADFNGWQTAYAFDVLRGVPGAIDDGTGSRKAFLDSAAAFRSDLAALADQRLAAADRDRVSAVLDLFDRFMALDKQVVAGYAAGTRAGRTAADDLVANDE